GFVFLSLEDETGIANVIVTPPIFARHRLVLVSEPYLLVDGIAQRQDGVISVRARRAQGLPALGHHVPSHDFGKDAARRHSCSISRAKSRSSPVVTAVSAWAWPRGSRARALAWSCPPAPRRSPPRPCARSRSSAASRSRSPSTWRTRRRSMR